MNSTIKRERVEIVSAVVNQFFICIHMHASFIHLHLLFSLLKTPATSNLFFSISLIYTNQHAHNLGKKIIEAHHPCKQLTPVTRCNKPHTPCKSGIMKIRTALRHTRDKPHERRQKGKQRTPPRSGTILFWGLRSEGGGLGTRPSLQHLGLGVGSPPCRSNWRGEGKTKKIQVTSIFSHTGRRDEFHVDHRQGRTSLSRRPQSHSNRATTMAPPAARER